MPYAPAVTGLRLPLLALCALLAAGCGGGGEDSASPAPTAPVAPAPPPVSISADVTHLAVSAARGSTAPTAAVVITVTNSPASVYFRIRYSNSGIDTPTDVNAISDTQYRILIRYRSPDTLEAGVYEDTLAISACATEGCPTEFAGSPIPVSSSYTVESSADPVRDPLPFSSRITLSHDIVDAEYSRTHDQLVMVSAEPSNALYVYDAATATERSLPLNKRPTAVSISPDGRHVAIGHDALITVVDLATVGQPGAPAPVLLNVATTVFDMAFDGRGRIHVVPAQDQWVGMHTVDVASNTAQVGGWMLRAGSHARLHPSGDFVYTADNGLSPSDIAKWEVTAATPVLLYDSPYHGDYGMCGNLWFSESGSHIYTACGNTFSSSTVRASDMVYTGRFELTGPAYQVSWAEANAARGEVSLIEHSGWGCTITFHASEPCYNHLGTWDAQFLTRKSLYSLPPVLHAGVVRDQAGLFVFYHSTGVRRFLLSKLAAGTGVAPAYLLTTVE